jgi:dipeptidase E
MVRGLFLGSGSDGLQHPTFLTTILSSFFPDRSPSTITVTYIGTATYDLALPRFNQTKQLAVAGCTVNNCAVTGSGVDMGSVAAMISTADVIIVSGGNTLYAFERWKVLGIDKLLHEAAAKGTVLAGGSAGFICWFDGGHSDSADPDSYYANMVGVAQEESKDESSTLAEGEQAKKWRYIRVPCLGIMKGLALPHADSTQSNGILRMTDFDEMMLRHPSERGITLDHWCGLLVDGETYTVVPLDGKPGSVFTEEASGDKVWVGDRTGLPGVWTKEVCDGAVVTKLANAVGKVSDLFKTAENIVEDEGVEVCRRENPCEREV